MKTRSLIALLLLGAVTAAAWKSGLIEHVKPGQSVPKTAETSAAPPPAVTVIMVAPHEFRHSVLVTGSLVPREEILVAPEIEGLKVVSLKADEGDRVKKGDTLAVLVSDTLEAQLAQNDAALARTSAAIAQANSQIVDAEARVKEAQASFQRAKPLTKSGYMTESTFDQREALARSAAAQLNASRDGLKFAEAQKAEIEAQRRELLWRRSNTEVKAPADGIVSRRTARVGAIAGSASEPLFRIIERGEIELDAEISETEIGKVAAGQKAKIDGAGASAVEGTVRLVSPEVDKATRLGRVRVFLGDNPALKIGSFARGTIETSQSRNLAIPQSAVLYGDSGATVLVVENGKVAARRVGTGLTSKGQVEILAGLQEGEIVVAKAGTFLRDGDAVRPVLFEPPAKVSEAPR